jgi:molybdopterin-containing oxidoreductase family membrane subunit
MPKSDDETASAPESARLPEAAPVLVPGHTYGSVTDKISALVLVRPYNWRWFVGFGIGFALTMLLLLAITWL